MIDFFGSIYAFIYTLVSYISNLLSSLIAFFTLITSGQSAWIYVVGFMPTFIGGAIMCFIGIMLMKMVIGVFTKG